MSSFAIRLIGGNNERFDYSRGRNTERQTCKSPIILKRIGKTNILLAFHKSYYDIPFLENALRCLSCGEVWDLYKKPDDPNSIYANYIISLQKDFGDKTDGVLLTIVDRAIKEVYQQEMSAWEKDVEIIDLVKPYCYSIADGANISNKTKRALDAAGIKTVSLLSEQTRENICQIPGMTTEEVVKLEKSLLSRGIQLKPAIPSFP